VDIYDTGVTPDGRLLLAMEYIDGPSLRQVGPLAPSHNDLKPGNLLLRPRRHGLRASDGDRLRPRHTDRCRHTADAGCHALLHGSGTTSGPRLRRHRCLLHGPDSLRTAHRKTLRYDPARGRITDGPPVHSGRGSHRIGAYSRPCRAPITAAIRRSIDQCTQPGQKTLAPFRRFRAYTSSS